MAYLEKVRARFAQAHLAQPDELVPCTADEIAELEQQLGLSLPQAYREFLLWMGRGAGPFLSGSECFCQDLPYLKTWAQDLLAENHFPQPLPDDAFVFFMHQGYQFAFLRTSEGNDPPVYYYNETQDQGSFLVTYPSFSRFLLAEIEAHAQILAEFPEIDSLMAESAP